MASSPPSATTLSLLDKIADLSDGLKNGRQGAREGLLDACTSLVSEISNPSEMMLRLLWSQPAHISVLWMAVEIKLFQAMESSPESGEIVTDIAKKCDNNVDPVLVGRMLRHLAAMGTVRETGPHTYALTPISRAFAEPAYQDSILYIADNFAPVHQTLPAYFRENNFKSPGSGVDGPFQYAYNCKGTHYFEWFQKRDPEMGRRFASMMETWSRGRPRWFYEEYYPVNERLISGAEKDTPFLVDVGGGSGHDVEGLREAFEGQLPGKLVLQDRPEIIDIAKIGAGVEGMAHDFLTEQPVKGARAYYLHSIIQDWNNEVNTQILKAIVPAMKKGYSKVLVNDFVVPNQGAHWAQTCLDWELMASLGARHRTETEHRQLYEGAGLKITGIFQHPNSLDSLIELELA
ncbi:O-methyltransferase [Cucurbitaria berberidis CBS 394.84]|uniref:O-methyltransferase n=1 Tax=Cucurbitaria berberidis CBS 394.84 TaxID=1168544 RepID=A0A9P4GAN9_9PLEO|nr:O-methyltransferase [Cucurbitaria berberidis CBS 394.84]KAF1842293.1 O-methyltransferase [Cucurbitaria berberidis CBS 394.84]